MKLEFLFKIYLCSNCLAKNCKRSVFYVNIWNRIHSVEAVIVTIVKENKTIIRRHQLNDRNPNIETVYLNLKLNLKTVYSSDLSAAVLKRTN